MSKSEGKVSRKERRREKRGEERKDVHDSTRSSGARRVKTVLIRLPFIIHLMVGYGWRSRARLQPAREIQLFPPSVRDRQD